MFQMRKVAKFIRIPLVQNDLQNTSHIWFDPDVTPYVISEFKDEDRKKQCMIHVCGSTFQADTSAKDIVDTILGNKESDERDPT